jgi:MFS family permease
MSEYCNTKLAGAEGDTVAAITRISRKPVAIEEATIGASTTPADEVRRAVIGSTVGNMIEAYDFLVYGLVAGLAFPSVFFPTQDAFVGTVLSFGTMFTAFLARPLGALLFGHFGDRIGRKTTLIATIVLMGIGTVGIGLVPGYAVLGAASVVPLIILRVVQGVALGGEWTGASLLALESGSGRRSGLLTSFAQGANPLGLALANIVILLVTAVLDHETFVSWGWRLPFLFSAVLVAVALWLRLRVHETVTFLRVKAAGDIPRFPIVAAFRNQPRAIVLSIFVRLSALVSYYLFTAFALTYTVKSLGYDQHFVLVVLASSAVVAALLCPLFGMLGDRWGHERVLMIGAILTAIYAFCYFPLLGLKIPFVAALAILGSLSLFAVMFAVEGVIITKVFEPRWRYSGSAVAFNLAAIVGAGPAPALAAILAGTGHITWVSAYIAIACVLSFCAAALLQRTPANHDSLSQAGSPVVETAP